MGFRVLGLGARVLDLGCRASGVGFRVKGLGGIRGPTFRVCGCELMAWAQDLSAFQHSGLVTCDPTTWAVEKPYLRNR